MTRVRVIVEDIPGLEIASAVDSDGTIWLVIGKDAARPHFAAAAMLEDVLGGLPDELTLTCDSAVPQPPPLRLVS